MNEDIRCKYDICLNKLYEAIDELSTSPLEETDEQLLGAIKNIKKTLERRKNIPKIVDSPDISELVSACEEHINSIKDFGHSCKNDKQWIYEEALEAIYGKNIFDWVNKYDKG